MYLYYVDTSNCSSLPNFKNGIDVSDPIHGHVIQISHLILEAVKEMPKNWLRYGERRVEDIVGVFVNLLAMHTDDSRFNLPKDILFPFHILSVLDPKAKWCTQWLHAAFGQHLFLNTLSQNMALVTFLVEEILSYLETYQNGHPGDMPENIIPGCIVKYATFTHTLSVLSQVVCFEKGRQFFPVVTKTTSELVSLEVMLVRMIMFLNSGSSYKSTVCMTPSGFEVILAFVKKLLQIGEEINENLMKTIIEPIKYRSMQPMKCNNIPCHTMKILLHLASSSTKISCLLGSRQKHKLSISKLNRNQNTTNTSAVGMRKTRQMNISLERQFSARSVRIPSIGNTDVSSPAKLIEHITTILMKHQDLSNVDELLSLVEMCGKLFRIHEGLSMLDAMNSQLISAVIVLYKQLSSEIESSRYCSAHEYPLKIKAGNPPHAVYMSLVSFLTEVASTPCGLYALAQEDSVLQDLLTTLFQYSYVPWEHPAFRHVVSLITAVWQGASVLAEESYRILTRPLCNLWSEFEDPLALMSGSERKQIEATQHFINVIYTFIPNLQGIMALLSEPDSSSEGTLVDTDMAPRTLAELLTFDSTVEPWHYISLLTLRALTTNMDVCLYLNSTIKYQEKLLKLQSENMSESEIEESRMKSNSVNKCIIIDKCSLLRHQILIATYAVGGPSERILPAVVIDAEHLDGDGESNLFCSLPPPKLASATRKMRSTRLKGQTDIQRFLQDTKQGLHDASWLSHARRAYRASCSDDIKGSVLLDLLEQVAKLSSNSQYQLSAPLQESKYGVLSPEECLGVQVVIRYGVELHLLQESPQNEENLTQLLCLLKHRKCETFQGLDWFAATVFLLCGGNMERCQSCIGNISALPVTPFLWPAHASAKDNLQSLSQHSAMFGHILELLIKMELPLAFSALQLAGASWWLICRQWMAQCFWNVLDWSEICHWLAVSILNQPDFILYFCVSLLQHIQPKILQAASEGNLWEQIMVCT
ncbi:hypothetical protein B7P43_G03500 [Cryptotermes secundus]|uniref:Protein broad-minded n=1 Tax=Cryptotermes secundus TaxID=105785 RepID=A0A2J7RG42_9NEOP|nr:hypothetical protein B7P43_G03500 [Cryptotermes secundus]